VNDHSPRRKPVKDAKPRPVAPYYDERFHGYGKDKASYVSLLRLMGYHFLVLPREFLVHHPHPPSQAQEVFISSAKEPSSLRNQMKTLYKDFLEEAASIHSNQHPTVQFCKR